MKTKKERHARICTNLNGIYESKNHDYGDSFAQLRERLPNAILIRLYDKYLRLETLLSGATQEVKNESIDDTLIDMANYCIMELVERQIEQKEPTEANTTSEKPVEPWGKKDNIRITKICRFYNGGTDGILPCVDCPFNPQNKRCGQINCEAWCVAYPAEARHIMDEWEAEHGVD